MSDKFKSFSDIPSEELAEIAKDATLAARQESLDAGLEVTSIDEEGNIVVDKKDESGNVVRKIVKKAEGTS